jgi:hypothetical protein
MFPVVPRAQAAELAERSASRAARVAACEFLHAAILWITGTNARRPEAREAAAEAAPTQFHAILVRARRIWHLQSAGAAGVHGSSNCVIDRVIDQPASWDSHMQCVHQL